MCVTLHKWLQIGGRLLLIATHLDQSNSLTNQEQVLGFARPFIRVSKLCKNAGPKPFCWAKPACFDFSSSLHPILICRSHTQHQWSCSSAYHYGTAAAAALSTQCLGCTTKLQIANSSTDFQQGFSNKLFRHSLDWTPVTIGKKICSLHDPFVKRENISLFLPKEIQ
jgi:hypothetical protein